MLRCIGCSCPERLQQAWIEFGHGGKVVIEHRRAVLDETVSFAKRSVMFAAKEAAERGSRRGCRRMANGYGDHGNDDRQADQKERGSSADIRPCSCRVVHAFSEGSVV